MKRSEASNPRLISLLAYIHWASPIGYALTLSALYNLPTAKAFGLFFSIYYIARSLLNFVVAWGLQRISPWTWQIYAANSLLMIFEQFYISAFYAENHNVIPSVVLASAVLCLGIWFVRMELSVPYFSPRIPWWESDPRYRISIPVSITDSDHFFEGQILDLSTGGCFIKSSAKLQVEDEVTLTFSMFEDEFRCKSRIVWKTDGAITHPRGLGARFLELEKEEFQKLKIDVKKLRGVSSKYREQRREEKAVRYQEKI